VRAIGRGETLRYVVDLIPFVEPMNILDKTTDDKKKHKSWDSERAKRDDDVKRFAQLCPSSQSRQISVYVLLINKRNKLYNVTFGI